jgi:protein TonB
MRSVGSTVSLLTHIAAAAALALGTANAHPKQPQKPMQVGIVLPPVVRPRTVGFFASGGGEGLIVRIPALPAPSFPAPTGSTSASPPGVSTPFESRTGAGESGINSLYSSDGPEMLSGPLPRYPELLRQAGVQGRVILEAVVDTTGRVIPGSVTVVSSTNPGFVGSAREALMATLFRPARVGGHSTRMRVRIPFEFTLKNGSVSLH